MEPIPSDHYRTAISDLELPGIDLNSYGQYLHDLQQPANQFLSVETFGIPKPPKEYIPYHNYIHAEGTSLLCVFNMRNRDIHHNDPTKRAFWSDVIPASLAIAMDSTGGSTMNLQ